MLPVRAELIGTDEFAEYRQNMTSLHTCLFGCRCVHAGSERVRGKFYWLAQVTQLGFPNLCANTKLATVSRWSVIPGESCLLAFPFISVEVGPGTMWKLTCFQTPEPYMTTLIITKIRRAPNPSWEVKSISCFLRVRLYDNNALKT